MWRNALLFLLNQDERKGLFASLLIHQESPLFPVLSNTALRPSSHLASNQGEPADVSSETTNMTLNTASRITDHYGTRFCNPFCSTSSVEIKASCVSVTLLQPEALSSSSSLVSSALSWHHSSLPSRTQLPTAADLNAGMRGGFCFPYPQF